MPVSLFTAGIDPKDPDTPIWRFMEFWKFHDLTKGHKYFRRTDKFDGDETEGCRKTSARSASIATT